MTVRVLRTLRPLAGAALAAALAACGSPGSTQAAPAPDRGSAATSTPTAPPPAPPTEKTPVKTETSAAPFAEHFAAARAAFAEAAAVASGAPDGDIKVKPEAPGDRFATDLDQLIIGDLLPFRALVELHTVLHGFAGPGGVARFSDGFWAAVDARAPVKTDEPGLALLFAAAKLGTDEALKYSGLRERLKFMLHRGKLQRLCPVKTVDGKVRVRWHMTMLGQGGNRPRGPGGPIQKVDDMWLTAMYDAAAGTVKLTSGDEGC